ncbi:RWD-domain-containing protein [Multifurca ochricompacta]|uniref:RWD-domain-containing protein n=1 Tax=Multifurca ochricompacta TaxID=376703 RepID=A0AAD4MA46_9AGAM|nr:RWD-domain-containing protein [Multifurca ochricompacta]
MSSSEVILEEFEVLESIYADELIKLSERDIRIDVEPDSLEEGEESLRLALTVHYTDNYPDVLPELSLDPIEGEADADEINSLLDSAQALGQENIGMAMTFTIVSHLREQLSSLIRTRSERRKKEDILEEEEARTRGTPVTVQAFNEWKVTFEREISLRKMREEEEKFKAMTAKEREEYRRAATRLTGRQLFERDKNLATSDAPLLEEGTVSVDVSLYERATTKEDDEEDRLEFSDSD